MEELDLLLNKLIGVLDRLYPLSTYSQQREIDNYKDFLSSVPRQLFSLQNDNFSSIHEETRASITATLNRGLQVLKRKSRGINNALNKQQRIKFILRKFNIGVKYNVESYLWRNSNKLEKLIREYQINQKLAVRERYERVTREARERRKAREAEKLRIEREKIEEELAYQQALKQIEEELQRVNQELNKSLSSKI